MHSWCFLAVFLKIIPKDSTTKSKIKSRKFRSDNIHRFLQQIRLNLFFQYRADSIGIRHTFAGDYRENIRGIIQSFPFDFISSSHIKALPLFAFSYLMYFCQFQKQSRRKNLRSEIREFYEEPGYNHLLSSKHHLHRIFCTLFRRHPSRISFETCHLMKFCSNGTRTK